MFSKSTFLVIQSDNLGDSDGIVSLLNENGALSVVLKRDNDNSIHYLDGNYSPVITHIISRTIQFIEYKEAVSSMVPVTTPEWVYDSIKLQKLMSPKIYNPDPKYFLKDCYVCVADNLPAGDKEVIYGGVKAFGGNYLDVLTKFTTHLIALDLSNEKSIIASSAIDDTTSEKIDIKIVLPHWIDQCIMLGKKVDESPYLLPNPPVLRGSIPNSQVSIIEELPNTSENVGFFNNKTFYISSDYKLSERLNNSINRLIKNQGGKIMTEFDIDSIDIYIGKERAGENYYRACKNPRIIVGNLLWLYHVIVNSEWILPINSNLLHYPFPTFQPLKNLNISITNYSGDARIYLSKIIELLGGTFTKTLTKQNDYLIAAKPEGKKYTTAVNKWVDENKNPKITVVNHLWLEECFANGELMDSKSPKFTFFGKNNDGVEFLIGKTKLNEDKLVEPIDDAGVDEVRSDSADRGDYDDEIPVKVRVLKLDKEISISKQREDSSEPQLSLEGHAQIEQQVSSMDCSETPAINKKMQPKTKKVLKDQNLNSEIRNEPKLLLKSATDAPHSFSRLGRSAAMKAASKLQSDIIDLNQYQEMIKSATKMKTYMNELEATLILAKRPAAVNTSASSNKKSKLTTKASESKNFTYIAVMTGCEQYIVLTENDKANLAKVGLKILSEYSSEIDINTLIAPKVLRTEKFLSSLSKVKRIIHPNYIIELRDKLNDENTNNDKNTIFKSINIDHFSLEQVLSIKEINLELGVANSKSNELKNMLERIDSASGLFSGTKLNLSTNLNGGVDVISKILKIHGLSDFREVKLTSGLQKSMIKNEKTDNYILVAHKTKDTKLLNSFRKLVKESTEFKGVIVEWDWCVKSIFQMKLQNLDDYKL